MFDPPDSIVPLLSGAADARTRAAGGPIQGRLTAWDSVTRANTVQVLGENRTNLPVLAPAEATLVAPCTVLLIPFGPTHLIAGRIRVP